MVALPLESLPLGFRFHPTDEELINHYLKGKISGRKPPIEVIPEIDVCKCEPWDLPDKSLIRTVDPEWFFFAPRDRKYPNGQRSNRATEKGYWKATGKDRTIKSRGLSRPTLIGMKKTLVFYRGRAPKGERTGWIMHEYRTVDNELDGAAGDQGAYVLCRLFKKPLEKENVNYDELDDGGFSPTPTKSSPADIPHPAEHGEELETTNSQETLVQNMQQDHQPLSGAVGKPVLADEMNYVNYPSKTEDSNSNSNITLDVEDYDVQSEKLEAQEDELFAALKGFVGFPLEPIHTSGFAQMDSSGVDIDFFSHNEISHHTRLSPSDADEPDSITEFLDSVLDNPDEYSSGESNDQKDLIAGIVPENGDQIFDAPPISSWDLPWAVNNGATGVIGAGLGPLQLQAGEEEDIFNPSMYLCDSLQQSSGIGHDRMNTYFCGGLPEASSMYSSTGACPELLNNLAELPNRKISVDTNDGLMGSGIKIRTRQGQHSAPMVSDQGTAIRRIRLARDKVPIESEGSVASESNSVMDVYKINVLTADVEEDAEKKVPNAEKTLGSVDISKHEISQNDEICSSMEDIIEESKPMLRYRKTNNDIDAKPVSGDPAREPQHVKSRYAFGYLALCAILLILLVMFLGLTKYFGFSVSMVL